MSRHSRRSSAGSDMNQCNARFFASSSNIGGPGDQGFIPVTADNGEQKQNMDIVKRLLEMFNLDDTMRKYESKNAIEFVLDPNDFGYDCSLSTTRVRQRLCDLMGTDVIRLNDKRYFQKLSKRLEEEYDTVMDKQEETRAARENERLRRLMLEGVIDAPNDYRAVVHGDHKPKHKKTKKRKIKRRLRISDSPSDYSTEHAQSEMTRHSDDDDNLTSASKEDIRTQVEFLSEVKENQDDDVTHEPSDSKPVLTSIIRKPGQNKNNDKSKNRAEMHARPPHHENTLRSSSSCSTYRKSRRIKSAAPRLSREADIQSDESTEDIDDQRYDTQSLPDRGYNRRDSKYSKHEPESVRRLRREQTVAGLYSIAEELVSPVRAEDSSRDKKVTSKS